MLGRKRRGRGRRSERARYRFSPNIYILRIVTILAGSDLSPLSGRATAPVEPWQGRERNERTEQLFLPSTHNSLFPTSNPLFQPISHHQTRGNEPKEKEKKKVSQLEAHSLLPFPSFLLRFFSFADSLFLFETQSQTMSTRVRVNYPDYDASEAAAIVFVVAFGISAIAHIVQASMRKSWWMWPLIVGVLGTFGRAVRERRGERGGRGERRRETKKREGLKLVCFFVTKAKSPVTLRGISPSHSLPTRIYGWPACF